MTEHHDALETRSPDAREADLFARLPAVLARGADGAGLCASVSTASTPPRSPTATRCRPCRCCARPICRRCRRPARPSAASSPRRSAPSAGSSPRPARSSSRKARGADPWGAARGLFAAGFRAGDVVLNTFGYHLTPGGFIMDSAARALGCAVIPAGPGNTEQQMEVIAAYRPERLCRHARFPEDPDRGGREPRRRHLLHQARRRLGRGLPALAAGLGHASAASTPISSTPPPMSASSPMRPPPARAWC